MPQKSNKKLLNLGCGSHFHKDWVNIDFASQDAGVISHNLLEGIPFPDNIFDAVYHSHLLEHFSKIDASRFIKECYRVLKPSGIIIIATPNLEEIVNNYQKYLRLALKGNKKAEANYDWTMLEMYDQCVRTFNGGEMGKIYALGNISNPEFVYKRTGIKVSTKPNLTKRNNLSKLSIKNLLLKLILGKEFKYYKLGKFRSSGEVHQWMYDRFSLARLLKQSGFSKPLLVTATQSSIPNWASYNLDTEPDGTVYKPDSFYMEAVK